MVQVVDQLTGRLLDANLVEFVDRIIPMSNHRSPWEVIDEMITFWASKNPVQYKSFIIEVKEKKLSRSNQYGGATSSGQRYMLDVPHDLLVMIRVVYPDMEFDKKFFREFAKRFKQFAVVDKI